jgi:uncharacterized Ntn-hydrolase superfamily protein
MRDIDTIPDPVHLRSLAQNDYNIDGNLLPDGVLLYEIAQRIERTEALLREQTHKAIEAAFALREAKRERDAARREVCELSMGEAADKLHTYAKVRGWDCYETKAREDAMDRLAQLDEELGL